MIYTSDTLVIGSGISGLNFAIDMAAHGSVHVITKKELMESNSSYAQGGIAAVLDIHDSIESHIRDTLETGCYINNEAAVRTMVEEGPAQIHKLIDYGVGFARIDGKLSLTQEANHSARRIAHVRDATGREIERALLHTVREHENIETWESHIAVDLIIKNNRCIGAIVLDRDTNKIDIYFAKVIAVATGGAAQVYARNCNPAIATGDGVAMAIRAGAKIQDMEFMQFHPTALAIEGKPTFLISETVRGEGGVLKNYEGKPFMHTYDERGDLAPRDVVSRAILDQLHVGPVFLDIRHKGTAFIKQRFPYIYEQLWWAGIKMDNDMIPVAPAAHYMCGGIQTDLDGQTSIPGLYSFGEAACTGVHGANRLASNSLLECMVFSSRAAQAAHKDISQQSLIQSETTIPNVHPDVALPELKTNIQVLMWKHVGIVRNRKDMKGVLAKLKKIQECIDAEYNKHINAALVELRNLCHVAIAITEAALERTESIGTHHIKKKK